MTKRWSHCTNSFHDKTLFFGLNGTPLKYTSSISSAESGFSNLTSSRTKDSCSFRLYATYRRIWVCSFSAAQMSRIASVSATSSSLDMKSSSTRLLCYSKEPSSRVSSAWPIPVSTFLEETMVNMISQLVKGTLSLTTCGVRSLL